DPLARQETVGLLRELAAEGRTIVVSSHVLYEIEALAREVVLIVGGRVLACGGIREIRGTIDRHPHTLRVRSAQARALVAELCAGRGTVGIDFSDDDRTVAIRTRDRAAAIEAIHEAVVAGRASVEALAAADDDLDAVFKY